MAAVAVLLIHIERTAVTSMTAASKAPGRPPLRRSTQRARRSSTRNFRNAEERTKPPRKRRTTFEKKGARKRPSESSRPLWRKAC